MLLFIGCFAWAKKLFFSAKQKVFVYSKLYALPSKASRFRNQKTAHSNNFLLSSKAAFFTYKKPFFCTRLFYCHPKQLFFALRCPFQRPLTYCLQRIQLFFCCSLNSLRCKAGASHRFKSLPAIPGEVAAFRKTGYLMIAGCFNNNHTSTGDLNRPRSPEVRKPLVCFLVLFAQRKKHEKRPFAGSSEVSQTSIQLAAMADSHRNN